LRSFILVFLPNWGTGTSEWFTIKSGVKQGCNMSGFLFSVPPSNWLDNAKDYLQQQHRHQTELYIKARRSRLDGKPFRCSRTVDYCFFEVDITKCKGWNSTQHIAPRCYWEWKSVLLILYLSIISHSNWFPLVQSGTLLRYQMGV
jgi:hypothetical protein